MSSATTTLGATIGLLLALAACVPDDGRDEASDTGATVIDADPPALDSTGAIIDPCADDYDGNQALGSAHALQLDTTEAALIFLGDGFLSGASAEQGQDRLAVCGGRPDFFSLDVACSGFLVVDTHGTGGGGIDLFVHSSGRAIDEAVGTWQSSFLKAIVRPIDVGAHVLEVRHSGNGAQGYAIGVIVLPIAPCP